MGRVSEFIYNEIEKRRTSLPNEGEGLSDEVLALAVSARIWDEAANGDETAQWLIPGDFVDLYEQVRCFI